LGGGVVLVARARRHRRGEHGIVDALKALESGDDATRLEAFVGTDDGLGPSPAEAALAIGVTRQRLDVLVASDPELLAVPDAANGAAVVLRSRWEAFLDELVEATAAFHESNPGLAGIELERLRTLPRFEVEPRLFRSVVDGLVDAGRLRRRGSTVSVPGHEISMSEGDESLGRKLMAVLREDAITPPSLKQIEEKLGIHTRRLLGIVGVLAERGEIVKVSNDLVFATEVIEEIERRLRAALAQEGEITAAAFRDLISASRKYSIPLLDYFDRCGVTLRSGDVRRLRSP
jgi:selenocysteine-specific elongation factor